MSDLSRYLPLSNRQKLDESAVDSTWSVELADVLSALTAALAPLPVEAWQAPSRRPTWSVHDLLAHLTWRLSTSRGERWRTSARSLAEQGFSAASAELAIARRVAASVDGSPDALLARLAQLQRAATSTPGSVADSISTPGAGSGIADDSLQRGIGALAEAVIAAVDIAASLNLSIAVPHRASGAVALRRTLEAPTEIKAVVRGRTIIATDAGWSFGHGPVLQGSAAELLLFLYGRSDTAPRAAPAG